MTWGVLLTRSRGGRRRRRRVPTTHSHRIQWAVLVDDNGRWPGHSMVTCPPLFGWLFVRLMMCPISTIIIICPAASFFWCLDENFLLISRDSVLSPSVPKGRSVRVGGQFMSKEMWLNKQTPTASHSHYWTKGPGREYIIMIMIILIPLMKH